MGGGGWGAISINFLRSFACGRVGSYINYFFSKNLGELAKKKKRKSARNPGNLGKLPHPFFSICFDFWQKHIVFYGDPSETAKWPTQRLASPRGI